MDLGLHFFTPEAERAPSYDICDLIASFLDTVACGVPFYGTARVAGGARDVPTGHDFSPRHHFAHRPRYDA